jgi:hypothetical protein
MLCVRAVLLFPPLPSMPVILLMTDCVERWQYHPAPSPMTQPRRKPRDG